MQGTVAEVTAISTPVNGPFSDVRIYYATVNIDEVVRRSPARASRPRSSSSRAPERRDPRPRSRPSDRSKASITSPLHQPSGPHEGRHAPWRWKRVELGLSDPDFVEVVSGVKQGDRVVADPRDLPVPDSLPDEKAGASAVASLSMQP